MVGDGIDYIALAGIRIEEAVNPVLRHKPKDLR
jgi:hypothetical protein